MTEPKNSIKSTQVTLCRDEIINAIDTLGDVSESHLVGNLTHIAAEILQKKSQFELLSRQAQTPLYAFDKKNLLSAMSDYTLAFETTVPNATHFYAVKLNHEPSILKTIFSNGFYADVSSARELQLAKDAGATKFLFSGPGKTKKELKQALESNVDVIINLDSFSELSRLNDVCTELGITECRAGIRVTFSEHQEWDKFGIPLDQLLSFFQQASDLPLIKLIGIQFHMSWNKDASTFEAAIQKLSEVLGRAQFKSFLPDISFIDIGGGFRPYRSEGYFPEETAIGSIQKGLAELTDSEPAFKHPYYILDSIPIGEYAKKIGSAIDTYLRPIKEFNYFTEPGRILVNSALHVLVSVVDVKSDKCVITDGGNNIVGFERFEFDYFPIVNISHPAMTERDVSVYGSLCMPQDYWGLKIYSDKICEGDLIVIPYQGALTYSTMSDFIKGRALVYELPEIK